MMTGLDVLVIGAGPAGIAAATEAARAGMCVELVEQRTMIGGAIYRQPADDAQSVRPLPGLRGRWQRLQTEFAASDVRLSSSHVFLGVDAGGAVMLDDRGGGVVVTRHPRVLILALGAVERILPRPGWQQAGVMAVGGMQLLLKEGRAPQGRVLLAGSGPLLLSFAQQLCAAGVPPIAVIEAGDPLVRPAAGLAVLRRGSWADMVSLLAPVLRRRFPWYRRSNLQAIEAKADGKLTAHVQTSRGPIRLQADLIGLHDGLRSNAFGLPVSSPSGPHILRAGDLNEVLGAVAAEADGRYAAQSAVALLRGSPPPAKPKDVLQEAAMQQALARLFQPISPPPLTDLPDETILCRCERRSLGDLRALLDRQDVLSAKEVRLNGRFGMGACQGRFCAENLASLLTQMRPHDDPVTAQMLTGARWPIRPVSLAALAASGDNVGARDHDG